jgi:hypothetical protein
MKLRRNAGMSSHEAALTAFDMQYPAMAKASADQSLPSKAGKVEMKSKNEPRPIYICSWPDEYK